MTEVIIALVVLVGIITGLIASFLQSRRLTEASVMHAAATSVVYGIIEQLKGIDYTESLPSTVVDPNAPSAVSPPYVRIRVNQELTQWLRVIHTQAPARPVAPTATPSDEATAASVGAIPNMIGPLRLSNSAGSTSQTLTLDLWMWVEEMPGHDADEVKKITIIYTYQFNDGRTFRTIRDREVFLRTRYDS